jgi:hypothetical protein
MNMEGSIIDPNCSPADFIGRNRPRRYPEEIGRVPMLEPQEEFILAERWREHGDRGAAQSS